MFKFSAFTVIVLSAFIALGAAPKPASDPATAEPFSGSPIPPVPFGWQAPVQLTSNINTDDACESNGWQVTSDTRGNVHLVWVQSPTSLPSSNGAFWQMWDQRNSWTSPVRISLSNPQHTSVRAPSIAADSAGNIWFAWSATNTAGQQHIYVRRWGPLNGLGQVDSCSNAGFYNYGPVVQCFRDTVHVLWHGNVGGPSGYYPVMHRAVQINADPGQWTSIDILTPNTTVTLPCLSVGRDNRLHAVWLFNAQVRYRSRVGGVWLPVESCSATGNAKSDPTVAVDTGGVIHVAWRQLESSGWYQQYYNYRLPSGGWPASPIRVAGIEGEQFAPRISCDLWGSVDLVWFGISGTTREILWTRRTPPGNFSTPTRLSLTNTNPVNPSAASCLYGNLHVVWFDTTGGVNGSDYEGFYRRYKVRHDVGVVRIGDPGSDVDSVFSVVTPTCTTVNYGELAETYRVRMRIGSSYDQTVLVAYHDSVSKREVRFPAFSAWPRGSVTVRCSLWAVGDTWFDNDTLSKRITGHVHDVRCDTMFAPLALVDSSSPPVSPMARIRNSGTENETFDVTFRVSDGYSQTLSASLSGGDTHSYVFPAWNHRTVGSYAALCSTRLAIDANRGNDAVQRSVAVWTADIAVREIEFPVGTVDSAAAIAPRVRFLNRGGVPATFDAWFRFDGLSGNVYNQHLIVTDLSPARESAVSFPEWPQPHPVGNYVSRCSIYQAGDLNRSNDALGGAFIVRVLPPPRGGVWVQKADLLPGGKQKSVKDGGAVAYGVEAGNDTGFVFALKGNSTYELCRYNPVSNAWVPRESIPAVNRLNRKKAVKKGSSLAMTASGMVYATKGNGTLDLWQYDPVARRWTQKVDVPPGSRALKEGTGMAATEVAGSEYLYLLKGSGTNEFYRYDVAADVWSPMTSPPLAGFKKGSCVAWDGGDTVFVLKGSTNEFLSYSVGSGTWQTRVGLPFSLPGSTRRKKVKDGAGLACCSRVVYALKGGATNEFWTYPCDTQNWIADNPMQPSPLNKTVKGGGCLTYARSRNAFYALRGNNTREFWMYTARTFGAGPTAGGQPNEAQGPSLAGTPQFELRVAPNPFSSSLDPSISYSLPVAGIVSLNLYDISGKLVSALTQGYHPVGSYSLVTHQRALARGIYLLRLEAGGNRTTQKLVVE